MPGISDNEFIRLIDQWALQKKAEDPGTSHPSGKADDGTQAANTGSRAAENAKDVKTNVPTSVDAASASQATGAGRGENTPTLHIGLDAAATGEEPAAETDRAKEKKEDPGTTHPSGAIGDKYASVHQLGNNILADIAVASVIKSAATEEVKAEDKKGAKCEKCGKDKCECPAEKKAAADEAPKAEGKKEEKKPAKEDKAEAKESVEEPAEAVKAAAAEARKAGFAAGQEIAKAAAFNAEKHEVVSSIIKAAAADADNTIAYLFNFAKAAEEDMQAEKPADNPQDKDVPQAPEEGAAGSQGGGQEAELEQLLQALLQAGVTPEELLALAQQVQGGGAGAAPAVPAGPAGGMEVAASAKSAAASKNDGK